MPESLHEKCLRLYQVYCLTGGMPEVVQEWISESQDLDACMKIQHDLLATYRDDFHKYGGEMQASVLQKIIVVRSKSTGK